MTSAADLSFAIAAYGINSVVGAEQQQIFDLLLGDNNVPSAWQRFFAKGERTRRPSGLEPSHWLSPGTVIFRLLEIKWFADNIKSSQQIRSQLSGEYTTLVEAAQKLNEFFERQDVPDLDMCEPHSTGEELNGRIRAARESMRWAVDFIPRLADVHTRIFERELPSSQKRDQPHLTFAVQFCRQLDSSFGAPGYGLVAAISAALYSREKSSELEGNIKKAVAADRKRRGEGGRLLAA